MRINENLINTKKSKLYYSLAVLFFFVVPYAIIPIFFTYESSPIITIKLVSITILGISSLILALFILPTNYHRSFKVILDFSITIKFVFFLFFCTVALIFLTAPSIPILDAILLGDSKDLSSSREDFLKTRVGWEHSLGYLISILTSYLIPYLIAFAHFHNRNGKWLYTGIFFLYCISFLEKAFFLKVAIPLFFIYLALSKKPFILFLKGFILILVLFYVMFLLSGSSSHDSNLNETDFFSMYNGGGSNIFLKIIWRITVVPILTAFDGINVFVNDFGNSYFYGRTSSLLSFLVGKEQINFERELFISQFGGNGFGNANQVYLIEAYVNFGYFGVVFFSLLVSYFINEAIKSTDLVYLSIMPLFLYNLFNAGLIGNMFSNGYIFFYMFLFIFKVKR